MNMINIDGRHLIEQHKNDKFQDRMRVALFTAGLAVAGMIGFLIYHPL